MPYSMRKVPKKNCYRISNPKTKKVFARCATKENAKSQLRLLRALQYNKNFVPRGVQSSRNRRTAANKTMKRKSNR